ncbi:hypothetical protein Btru_035740 [Bulinus truncatus]|nr:hypothetical protein Btru_035740 [Bulinus truncatus]
MWSQCRANVEAMWSQCGGNVEPMRTQCGGNVEPMWRQCGGNVEAMLRQCGGNVEAIRGGLMLVEAMLRQCGGNVEAMWSQCGGNVEAMWRQCGGYVEAQSKTDMIGAFENCETWKILRPKGLLWSLLRSRRQKCPGYFPPRHREVPTSLPCRPDAATYLHHTTLKVYEDNRITFGSELTRHVHTQQDDLWQCHNPFLGLKVTLTPEVAATGIMLYIKIKVLKSKFIITVTDKLRVIKICAL